MSVYVVPTKAPEYAGQPITTGVLLPKDRNLAPIPLKQTEVSASIIGLLCDVSVKQIFHNTHTRPIEALYVFPLPEDAAVTELTLKIGDRVIEGKIREVEEAKKEYAEARDEGLGAALLEQNRPNIFTISVANIQPNEQIEVALRFHDHVPYENEAFEFSFPTVVLPRYVPPESSEVADADRITATPLLPEGMRNGHTLSLKVSLEIGGLEANAISCPSHAIDLTSEGGKQIVTLRQADAIPNKDFILRYRVASDKFKTTFFTHRPAGRQGTFLMLITPPAELNLNNVLPRELLFVFDRSGSMGGDSIVQARNAIHSCLRGLNEQDTFNIFPFDDRVEQFAPHSLPNTQENQDKADAYIEKVEDRGGTEILAALQTALKQPVDPERRRVIVFLTDGAVGNEDQVLRELRRSLNGARVFAFGIGSAVNRFLLDKLAEVGRGTVEYVFPGQDIADAVQRFQNRAAFPVLYDLELDWGGMPISDVYPSPIPDLYAGQPLTILGRFYAVGETQVRLKGKTRQGTHEQVENITWPESTLEQADLSIVLAQVWARARIDALMTKERDDPKQRATVRDEILGVALVHHLVSPYTALIAVEERQTKHEGRDVAETVVVPIHLPQGTHREAFEASPMLGASYAPPSPQMVSAPSGDRGKGIGGGMRGGMRRMASGSRGISMDFGLASKLKEASYDLSMSIQAPEAEEAAKPSEAQAKQRAEAALRYLARTQKVSGAWGESVITTTLALLAFLQNGHTDRAGSYRPQLTKTVQWLTSQFNNPQVATIAVWALAELAKVTGATNHTAARDAALAHAQATTDLQRQCLTFAQEVSQGKVGVTANPVLKPQLPPASEGEQGILKLVLGAWGHEEATQALSTLLAKYQQLGGNTDGAIILPGCKAAKPDNLLLAATAAGALTLAAR